MSVIGGAPDDVADLYELSSAYEDEYFQLGEDPAALTVFRRARAVDAVAALLDRNSLIAACDAIYEAYHAVEDGGLVLRTVDAAISALD